MFIPSININDSEHTSTQGCSSLSLFLFPRRCLPSLLPFPHSHTTLIPRRQPREPAAQGCSAECPTCPRHSSSSCCSINKPTMSNLVNKACVLEYGTCPHVGYKTQNVRDTTSNESHGWRNASATPLPFLCSDHGRRAGS